MKNTFIQKLMWMFHDIYDGFWVHFEIFQVGCGHPQSPTSARVMRQPIVN